MEVINPIALVQSPSEGIHHGYGKGESFHITDEGQQPQIRKEIGTQEQGGELIQSQIRVQQQDNRVSQQQ